MRTIYHNWLLDELVTRFGEQAVEKIVATFGSENVYVPKTARGPILDALGLDITSFLVAERGGLYISIPPMRHVQNQRRISKMHMDVQRSDEPSSVLAKKHGVTIRQIENIRAKRRDQRIS